MTDISTIENILVKMQEKSPSGFAIAFHIRLTAPDFLFQTYPKAWIDTYSEKGYVMVDPIVRWGFANTGSTRWSGLADLDDQNMLEQSLEYGMAYGVAIATETGNSRSFAGFARSDREYTDAEIADLTADMQMLHDLTAGKTQMDPDIHAALHRMSVTMTRPTQP